MSPLFPRALFACTSIALTAAMVAASAPTYAGTTPAQPRQSIVQTRALDLADQTPVSVSGQAIVRI